MKKVFITGGSSGIGEGLAAALHQRGVKVLIGGRSLARLQLVTNKHTGMEAVEIDVSDLESVRTAFHEISSKHPDLDTLVNNAGIQHLLDFTGVVDPEKFREEIGINFTGLVSVTAIFLPLLRNQSQATIVNVSSGLALVPLTAAPVYSATKAAVHSFTISLREQLRGTNVRVREILPPAVETNLHNGQPRKPKKVMPLEAFIKETMSALDSESNELPIGLVKFLRYGSRIAPGKFLKILNSKAE